ncbi:unnamed protein product, partial [Prunus brigantina]
VLAVYKTPRYDPLYTNSRSAMRMFIDGYSCSNVKEE